MSIMITYASNSANVEKLKTLKAKAEGDKTQSIKTSLAKQKLLKQCYVSTRLKSSLQKLYYCHHKLVDRYEISLKWQWIFSLLHRFVYFLYHLRDENIYCITFILCLACPMFPMSLNCPYFITPSVFSNVYLRKTPYTTIAYFMV